MIEVDESWNHPFSVASHWWLPERPDDRIAGTINYENGAIRVEILGTLERRFPQALIDSHFC